LFQHIIDKVPDYKRFLTVREMDENTMLLAEKYSDAVEVFEAGKSKKGHPIYCLKIGKGSKNALAYGCPHPNEPIGAMMLEHFSECLAEDKKLCEELDYTWYIIKCSDPDGVMMNEGWFEGPFTLYHYARNYYRPAGHLQVEWTFPIEYKKLSFNNPIPETKAIMKIIEDTRPVFMYSLHNAGFGGAYWYMSREMPEVYDGLAAAAKKQGVPLNLGEPESPYCREFGPAIYETLDIVSEYDYMEKYTEEDISKVFKNGTSCDGYARDICNPFTLLSEVPYFYDPRIDDTSISQVLRRDCLIKAVQYEDGLKSIINSNLDGIRGYISEDNLFNITLSDYTNSSSVGRNVIIKMAETREEYQRRARVSEEFGSIYSTRFYNLLALGLLVRASEFELEKLGKSGVNDAARISALTKAHREAEEILRKTSEVLENELNYSAIPIQKLVRIQLESGLIVAFNLNKKTQ